ncbi:MAG: hypothetical protein ACOYOB_20555 [Myxococcota bacterium]
MLLWVSLLGCACSCLLATPAALAQKPIEAPPWQVRHLDCPGGTRERLTTDAEGKTQRGCVDAARRWHGPSLLSDGRGGCTRATYRAGVLDGPWTQWSLGGGVTLNGPGRWEREKGDAWPQPCSKAATWMESGTFRSGVREGIWWDWQFQERVRSTAYVNGKKHGDTETWQRVPEGAPELRFGVAAEAAPWLGFRCLVEQGQWQDDSEAGLWRQWEPCGDLVEEFERSTRVRREAVPLSECDRLPVAGRFTWCIGNEMWAVEATCQDGAATGPVTIRDSHGTARLQGNAANGSPTGEWLLRDGSGDVVLRGSAQWPTMLWIPPADRRLGAGAFPWLPRQLYELLWACR